MSTTRLVNRRSRTWEDRALGTAGVAGTAGDAPKGPLSVPLSSGAPSRPEHLV
jgi:hypothetical protein